MQDVNRIIGRNAFTHFDAFDPDRAYEMFCVYVRHYAVERRLGSAPTWEDAARIWNGGPNGYKKVATEKYWRKVQLELSAQDK